VTRSAIALVVGLSLLTACGEVGSSAWQMPATNAPAAAQTTAPAVQGQVGGVEFVIVEEVFEVNRPALLLMMMILLYAPFLIA
jgi:ABC-type glycerol-3-phosphate transport system substrate-binding protein